MTLQERETALASRYGAITDVHERLAVIVADSGRAAPLREGERTDDRLVPGCQSRVWVAGDLSNGVLRVRMEAESPMVRGLVALVCCAFDGLPPAEAARAPFTLLETLALTRTLSPTRLHGLAQVERRLRTLATAEGGA